MIFFQESALSQLDYFIGLCLNESFGPDFLLHYELCKSQQPTPVSGQCFNFISPKNTRKPKFSGIFRVFKMEGLARNRYEGFV